MKAKKRIRGLEIRVAEIDAMRADASSAALLALREQVEGQRLRAERAEVALEAARDGAADARKALLEEVETIELESPCHETRNRLASLLEFARRDE